MSPGECRHSRMGVGAALPQGGGDESPTFLFFEPAGPEKQALLKSQWVAWKASGAPRARHEGSPTPIPAPRGGAVLAAGRAREPGTARLCLARALERIGGPCRVKGALRRASPALDPA
jgi:hypothetical protein